MKWSRSQLYLLQAFNQMCSFSSQYICIIDKIFKHIYLYGVYMVLPDHNYHNIVNNRSANQCGNRRVEEDIFFIREEKQERKELPQN